jgi:hypothetical protein
MKYILFTLSLLILWSCSLSQKSVLTLKYPSVQTSKHPLATSIARIDDNSFAYPGATITIDSIILEENFLWIKYQNFTADARLELVGRSAIAKSFPPIRACKIIAHDDVQKGEASAAAGWLKIDISDLSNKKVKDNPIYLQLEGWSENILYLYPY